MRGIGRKVKGIGSSSSTPSSQAPSGLRNFPYVSASKMATQAEAKQANASAAAYVDSMWCLVVSLQSQLPNVY